MRRKVREYRAQTITHMRNIYLFLTPEYTQRAISNECQPLIYKHGYP